MPITTNDFRVRRPFEQSSVGAQGQPVHSAEGGLDSNATNRNLRGRGSSSEFVRNICVSQCAPIKTAAQRYGNSSPIPGKPEANMTYFAEPDTFPAPVQECQ